MKAEINNIHCFKWLETYIKRLKDLHGLAFETIGKTSTNLRVERIKAHCNKYHELYEIEYTDFEKEKRHLIKVRIDTFPLSKHKHNVY